MGKLIKEQSLILETRKGLVIIREIIYKLKDLGVEKVASSHCTGEEAINLFKESWGKHFVERSPGKGNFLWPSVSNVTSFPGPGSMN